MTGRRSDERTIDAAGGSRSSVLTGQALFWTLALAVGILFQTPAPRPSLAAGGSCPEPITKLSKAFDQSRGSEEILTCRGWTGVGLAVGDASADVLVGDARPRLGEPCEDQHYYRVTFIQGPSGVRAIFSFAGGVITGSLLLPADQVRMIGSADAYVTDIQLGTYEPAVQGQRELGLTCTLDPTFHFYCPSSRSLDRLCVTWIVRTRTG